MTSKENSEKELKRAVTLFAYLSFLAGVLLFGGLMVTVQDSGILKKPSNFPCQNTSLLL
jgi:hypothetical protein